jgi:hypothetical protein
MSQPTTGIYFSASTPAPPPGSQNTIPQSDGLVPLQKVSQWMPAATDLLTGAVRPDNITILVDENGVLSSNTAGASDFITALQQQLYVFGRDTGTANAYVIAQNPPPTIVVGSKVVFLAAHANTGPSTLTIDSSPVSTAPITKEGTVPLTGGEIAGAQIIEAVFDGTNWQIVGGGSGGSGAGGSGGGGGGGAGSGLGDVIPAGAIDGVNTIFTIPTDGSPGPDSGTPTGLRGSAIQAGTGSNNITINFPAGAVAGDLAILFCGYAYPVDVPSGWDTEYSFTTGLWNVFAASRVLTSGDISAGNVNVSNAGPYLGVNFDMCLGIAVFVGAGGGVRETQGNDASGTTTITNSTSAAVQSSDTAIYWATNRSTSSPTLPVITPASGAATDLEDATTTNAWSLLASQAMPGGVLAVTSTFPLPGGGGGIAAIQVIVENSASGGGGSSGGARGNLYLNGALQDPLKADPDYTLVGTTITMRTPPVAVPSPDSLLWVYLSGSVGPPGPAGGGITTLVGDVTATGLGTVTATLAASGVVAGTYEKVAVDGKGRVTAGAQLSESDIISALGVQAENSVLIGPIGPTSPAALMTVRPLVVGDLPLPVWVQEVPAGTMNGVNTVFTSTFTPYPAASAEAFLNGVFQDTDWVTISLATFTFTVPPKSTDKIRVKYTH